MLRNTESRYGVVTKLLHGSAAAPILGLIWLGWYMAAFTTDSRLRTRTACSLSFPPGLETYALYEVETVSPPRPVQSVWKNSPRGRSMRSYVWAPK